MFSSCEIGEFVKLKLPYDRLKLLNFMCQFVPQAKGGGWGWQETGVAPESDRMKPSVCESFCLTSMTPCSCEEEVWIGISFDLELKKYHWLLSSHFSQWRNLLSMTLRVLETRFFICFQWSYPWGLGRPPCADGTEKVWNLELDLLDILYVYLICHICLTSDFLEHFLEFVEPLLNPMDMLPMWGIPLQGKGYSNGFRHVSTKEWVISYRILKNCLLLNVYLNKNRLFKWEQSFEGFQWLRLVKRSHDVGHMTLTEILAQSLASTPPVSEPWWAGKGSFLHGELCEE